MMAAFAELERDIIHGGHGRPLAARAQGRRGGRPLVMDADKLAAARARRKRGQSPARIARALGVSRASVYRHLGASPQTRRTQPDLSLCGRDPNRCFCAGWCREATIGSSRSTFSGYVGMTAEPIPKSSVAASQADLEVTFSYLAPGDTDPSWGLDGRDHLADRLSDEVDWMRQCADWLRQLDGAATRRRSTCARPPTGQTGPSSPSTSRGCRRSSTASPPTDELARARRAGDLDTAAVLPDRRAETPPTAGRAGPGIPGLLRPQGIARLINPATGAGLGRMAGRAVPARRDRPAAGLHRQPVPATLTARPPARVQETGHHSGAHGSIVTGTPRKPAMAPAAAPGPGLLGDAGHDPR